MSDERTEAARLRLLADYGVMDTDADQVLDQVVALASSICETPISLISLVDDTRQWFKAKVGLAATQTPRELAFCAHAIQGDSMFTVGDARVDPRFATNPLVTGDPNVVFYAGAPLIVEGGLKLGTLCIIDRKPRELTAMQHHALSTLATMAVKRLQDLRDLAEERAAKHQLEAALASIGDAVVATDRELRISVFNRIAEQLTGWSAEDALGRPIDEVVRFDRERAFGQVVATGVALPLSVDATLFRRDGRALPVADSVAPIRNSRGEVRGAIVVFRDDTERRLHDIARARVDVLLETMSDGYLAIDADWKLVVANRAFEQVSGHRREDVLGRDFWDLFPLVRDERGATWTNYNRCMTERVPVSFQSYYAPRDAWTDQRVNPTADGGIAVFFHDITEAKRNLDDLNKQAAFERQLIGIVSHDLRGPLAVITMATTLLGEYQQVDPPVARLLARIARSTNQATEMIHGLLDFTQVRAGGGIRVERTPGDLAAIARATLEELQTTNPIRKLVLRREGSGQGSWDEARIAQVVQNLVGNALKYSTPESAVEVTIGGTDEVATLSVHNEGPPISEATQRVLFEPFERGTAKLDAATRSVGLGLYIVRHIVAAHGGAIDVRSTAGEGTTFRVTIPR